jgi:outer membrane protein assembly factor BamB
MIGRRKNFVFYFNSISIIFLTYWISVSSAVAGFRGQQDPVVSKTEIEDLSTRQNGEDWPSFLGKNRDGKSSEKGILQDWSAGRLKVAWRRKVGETYSACSVSRGRLFHFERIDGNNVLFCLNAESGKEIWRYQYASNYADMYGYNNGPRCSPIVDENRVFIYGPAGELHCVDVTAGKRVWKVDTAKDFGVVQNFFGVGSTPIIHQDLIIAMVGGSPAESQDIPRGRLDLVRHNGTAIVALDKKTGQVRYQLGDDLASYASPVLQKVNGKLLGLAFARGGLIGFDPDAGKQRFYFDWRSRKFESVNASTPLVINDQVFLSECYSIGSVLLSINKDVPKIIWSDKQKRPQSLLAHWNTPIEINERIYGCSGRHAGEAKLRCVDTKTGKILWSQAGLTRSALTYIDDHFVVLTERGRLMLIKVNDKKFELVTEFEPLKEDAKLAYPCWAAPVISHGLMYILSRNQLTCFELIAPKK